MIHRFNYPAFRSAYVRAKQIQRLRATEDEQAGAYITSVVRPTEFKVELRLRLARSRLALTPLEKRVLHYDKQYLRTHDGDVHSDYVTPTRMDYIAARAGCSMRQVARILEEIEWLYWAADTLGVEVETAYVRCARRGKRVESRRQKTRNGT